MALKTRPLLGLHLLLLAVLATLPSHLLGWGHQGHIYINFQAASRVRHNNFRNFFYEQRNNLATLAPRADEKRRLHRDEAPRHFLNTESFGLPPTELLSLSCTEFMNRWSAPQIQKWGNCPWAILITRDRVLNALLSENWGEAREYAGDLGHYIGDLAEPLHVTTHFDGKTREAAGVHFYFEVDLFRKMESKMVLNPTLPHYLDGSIDSLRPVVLSGLEMKEGIFAADFYASRIDPLKSNIYFHLFEQQAGRILIGRIEIAVDLLASFYHSILIDYDARLAADGGIVRN